MRILVLEGLAGDVALREQSAGLGDEQLANRQRHEDDWRIFRVNPADACALDVALDIKASRPGVEVTLLHLGPPAAVEWMRTELARGCDAAVRIWDVEIAEAGTQAKALVLAAAVSSHGFELVLCGDANAASAGGQLGVLLARHLAVPCVTRAAAASIVEDMSVGQARDSLRVSRALDRGYVEHVEVRLPAVITVVAEARTRNHTASLPALLAAQEIEVPAWDLATLGVSATAAGQADAPLRRGALHAVKPKQIYVASPDSHAAAFDRILQIVAGTVRRREGRVVRGAADVVVEELFASLRDDGWLDHLRRPTAHDASEMAPAP